MFKSMWKQTNQSATIRDHAAQTQRRYAQAFSRHKRYCYLCMYSMYSCTPYTWGGWGGPPWPKYFLRALSRREACEWQSGEMNEQGTLSVHSTQHKHCTLATVLWNTSWYLVTVLCTTAEQVRAESPVHTWIVLCITTQCVSHTEV